MKIIVIRPSRFLVARSSAGVPIAQLRTANPELANPELAIPELANWNTDGDPATGNPEPALPGCLHA